MLVRIRARKGSQQAKSLIRKVAIKLPGSLSLADLDRDGKLGIPLTTTKIATGRFDDKSGVHVGNGKKKATKSHSGSRSVSKATSLSAGENLSPRTPNTSRSQSFSSRPSRESRRHCSTRISPSNQTKIVLPHESAL